MAATLGGAPVPGGEDVAGDLTVAGDVFPVAPRAPTLAPTAPATGRTPAPVVWEELAGGDARGLDLEFRSGALVGATDATSGQTYSSRARSAWACSAILDAKAP